MLFPPLKNLHPTYPLLLAGLCALALISAPTLRYYAYRQDGMVLGEWRNGAPRLPLTGADLDRDGRAERIVPAEGKVSVRSGAPDGGVIYASPPGWQVEQAEFADLNGDGRAELVMLVWREFAPWPVDRLLPSGGRIGGFHDADNRSCHIILMGWKDGRMREVWAGSALAEPVLAFAASDLDGDGRTELVTMDGDYARPSSQAAKAVRIWEWNGFGFTRLEQIDLPARQILINGSEDGTGGLIVITR